MLQQLPLDAYGCFNSMAMAACIGSSEPTKAISSEPTQDISSEARQPSAISGDCVPGESAPSGEHGASEATEPPKKPKGNYEVTYRIVGVNTMAADADDFV